MFSSPFSSVSGSCSRRQGDIWHNHPAFFFLFLSLPNLSMAISSHDHLQRRCLCAKHAMQTRPATGPGSAAGCRAVCHDLVRSARSIFPIPSLTIGHEPQMLLTTPSRQNSQHEGYTVCIVHVRTSLVQHNRPATDATLIPCIVQFQILCANSQRHGTPYTLNVIRGAHRTQDIVCYSSRLTRRTCRSRKFPNTLRSDLLSLFLPPVRTPNWRLAECARCQYAARGG